MNPRPAAGAAGGERHRPQAVGPKLWVKGGRPNNPIYWLALVMLVVWNVWLFIPRQKVTVTLPYSEFIAQLSSGNVSRVHIAGAAISGEFVQPVVWPPPGPALAGSKSKAAPSRYLRFQTTYPTAVGDTTLMPRLRAHHVRIEAVSPSLPSLALLLTLP